MNRLKSSHSCRLCRRWLEGEWSRATTVAERQSLHRQMTNGLCDDCQIKRHNAALAYMAASDFIRVLQHFERITGRPMLTRTQVGLRRGEAEVALDRIYDAADRCWQLHMWNYYAREPFRGER